MSIKRDNLSNNNSLKFYFAIDLNNARMSNDCLARNHATPHRSVAYDESWTKGLVSGADDAHTSTLLLRDRMTVTI